MQIRSIDTTAWNGGIPVPRNRNTRYKWRPETKESVNSHPDEENEKQSLSALFDKYALALEKDREFDSEVGEAVCDDSSEERLEKPLERRGIEFVTEAEFYFCKLSDDILDMEFYLSVRTKYNWCKERYCAKLQGLASPLEWWDGNIEAIYHRSYDKIVIDSHILHQKRSSENAQPYRQYGKTGE